MVFKIFSPSTMVYDVGGAGGVPSARAGKYPKELLNIMTSAIRKARVLFKPILFKTNLLINSTNFSTFILCFLKATVV